ncbi:MAG TPA: alpha/beta hydrolase [Lacipirellulaceae bacterium]|nr:alpha/beta hydrolase [Lacipirellulaceae bacterium]
MSVEELPLPIDASPRLQALISQPVPPLTSMPNTIEGWRKFQREEDAEATKITRAAVEMVGATVDLASIAGVPCFRVTPRQVAAKNEGRLIFHVHGGAFVFNGGYAAVGEAALIADAFKACALSVDYRRPPDHPFPAAPDDVLAVWKTVVGEHDAAKIAMAGTSAGGGLIMTTLLRFEEFDLPRPGAAFIGTPAADLTKTGDSTYLNAEVDHVLGRYEGRMEACLRLYAASGDLKDPMLSPIYGDLSGFPPTILISGTRDLLLSSTIRTHRKLRTAGATAELHVYEGQSHADYLMSFPGPESQDALGEIAQFFDRHLRY